MYLLQLLCLNFILNANLLSLSSLTAIFLVAMSLSIPVVLQNRHLSKL